VEVEIDSTAVFLCANSIFVNIPPENQRPASQKTCIFSSVVAAGISQPALSINRVPFADSMHFFAFN
jgi:hypothetical protein